MKEWKDSGLVETIYEEEQEDVSNASSLTPSSTASPSPPHSTSSPSSSSLRSKVEEWSRITGCKADVVVHVHHQCFHLHKDRLVSRSGYLRRRLTDSSAVTVSPPFNIDAETFATVADFCYGADIAVTPFNVASLRVAAELLEMTEADGDGGWNLAEKTERYLRRAVYVNPEYAAAVLRTCVDILPKAKRTALMASRCVAALAVADGVDGGGGWLEDVASIEAGDFQMVANSMRERSTRSHDLLYRIVDYYLKNHTGKLTEEDKVRICYTVDSKRLSHRQLIHLIQNQRMPLRFIVQAMLVEQLLTRHSIFDRVRKARGATTAGGAGVTLGSILQRDATLRQAAHLRASMEATRFKIRSLERDLADMKRRLNGSQERSSPAEARLGYSEPAGSASCRFFGTEEKQSVERWVSSMRSCNGNAKNGMSLGQLLLNGFRNVFRRTRPGSETLGTSSGGRMDGDELDAAELDHNNSRRRPTHRRHHSFT